MAIVDSLLSPLRTAQAALWTEVGGRIRRPWPRMTCIAALLTRSVLLDVVLCTGGARAAAPHNSTCAQLTLLRHVVRPYSRFWRERCSVMGTQLEDAGARRAAVVL